jgi:hypothetical protein
MTWRVVTHDRNRSSLVEVQERWCMTDLINAHLALDVHDELAWLQANPRK